MPDYGVSMTEDDMVLFHNRGTMNQRKQEIDVFAGSLQAETYHDARMIAPGWDIYLIEQEWRSWMTEQPRHPDAAFF